MSNKMIKTPDAATGNPAMKIDFDFERRLFNMTMEHRAVEDFYTYAEMVKSLYGDYNDAHRYDSRIGFEYKKDIRAEWVKYIVEKFSITDEQVICEVEKYYDENKHFIDNFDILYEIEKYAKKNKFILHKRWYGYDTPADVFLEEKLDMNNGIHRTASHIAGYTDAYREAMCWDVVKYRGDVHIPMEIFDEGERDILEIHELDVKKLVCHLGKMVDDLEVKKDEVVVYIDK